MTIAILGASGMLGSAIARQVIATNPPAHERFSGAIPILTPRRREVDLEDAVQTWEWFAQKRPTHVYLCAAKVGGIGMNMAQPWEMLRANLAIQQNVFEAAVHFGVERLLFVGSSCCYPRGLEVMREEDLMTGPLEPTNSAYAVAKIAGIEACKAMPISTVVPMLPNLYGPGDNFDLESSHVVAAMIRKFHEAKCRNEDTVTLWGTGKPVREFLFVEDAARACIELMNSEQTGHVNIAGHSDTISELAKLIQRTVDFDGFRDWDASKPDGFPVKVMSNSIGFMSTPLEEGIKQTYAWFLRESMRGFDRKPAPVVLRGEIGGE